MPNFTESEANEILRTAVRLGGPEHLNFDDLSRAAGELGVSPEALEEAEARFQVRQVEANARAEFRALHVREYGLVVSNNILLILIGCVINSIKAGLQDALFVSLCLLPLAFLLANPNRYLNRKSRAYQRDYIRWHTRAKRYLKPERAQLMIEAIVREKVGQGADRAVVLAALRTGLDYDKIRARRVLDAFISQHPEVAALLLE